jgi:hypothetical protein
VTGEWRNLHNEELNDLYYSHNIFRIIKLRGIGWGTCSTRESRGIYRVLVGKPKGKRQLERPRRRWEDNIKLDLQEVECADMDCIDVARDGDRWRVLVNTVLNFRIP